MNAGEKANSFSYHYQLAACESDAQAFSQLRLLQSKAASNPKPSLFPNPALIISDIQVRMPTPSQSEGSGQARHPLFRQHPSAMLAPIEILSRHLLCPPVSARITLRTFLKTTAGFQAFKTLSTRVASFDFQQSQYFSFLRQESRLPRIEMQSVHPEIHRWWPESMQVIHAAGVPPKRLSRWRSAWLPA